MRTWMEAAATVAEVLAVVGIGTVVVATVMSPVVFPLVVTGGLAAAVRRDAR